MKISPSTIKIFKRFKKLGSEIILVPPHRYFIFALGEYEEHVLVVEGTMADRVDEIGIFELEGDSLKSIEGKFDPKRRLGFFNALYDRIKPIARLSLQNDIKSRLLTFARKNKGTHIRIYQKADGVTKARVFDARKYYDELISESNISNIFAEELLRSDAELPFYVYLKVSSLRMLPTEDYEVTIYDNGLIDFDGVDSGICFHMPDQRLGEHFEITLDRLSWVDNALTIDPRRVPEIHRKMNLHH